MDEKKEEDVLSVQNVTKCFVIIAISFQREQELSIFSKSKRTMAWEGSTQFALIVFLVHRNGH